MTYITADRLPEPADNTDLVLLTPAGRAAVRYNGQAPVAWAWDVVGIYFLPGISGPVVAGCEAVDSLVDLTEACTMAAALNRAEKARGGHTRYEVQRHGHYDQSEIGKAKEEEEEEF